jgi:C_GCAxxG_C_C family probable redox protein
MHNSKVEQAVAIFKEGFNCSQALLAAYGPELGLERELALKAGQPFGRGLGGQGRTCGAVSAACMVLGLKFASASRVIDKANGAATHRRVRDFCARFAGRNGSLECSVLLGRAGQAGGRSAEDGKPARGCADYVREAGEILDEMLES